MEVPIETFMLEKLLVSKQLMVDMPTLRSSLELSSYIDCALQRMVYSLEAYVLAEEIDNRTKEVSFQVSIPKSWWQHFKRDVTPRWFVNLFPVRFTVIKKTKSVTFRKLATFPKANIALPEELGSVVINRAELTETERWE